MALYAFDGTWNEDEAEPEFDVRHQNIWDI